MTFTIGADPEVFTGINGKFVSGHDLVPGTKLKPFRVDQGAVQVDGMALEYNIDPCSTKDEFIFRVKHVLKQMEGMIKGRDILPVTSVKYTPEDVADVPAINRELGCSVDFNAYTCRPNKSPSSKKLMRTAGGHVHIGGFYTDKIYTQEHLLLGAELSKLMDKYLGIYSLLWDKDTERRSMYGKAGCFRPTTYGLEYRSLSNLWIFDDDLISFVYDATLTAYTAYLDGERVFTNRYENIINKSQFKAKEIQNVQLPR